MGSELVGLTEGLEVGSGWADGGFEVGSELAGLTEGFEVGSELAGLTEDFRGLGACWTDGGI